MSELIIIGLDIAPSMSFTRMERMSGVEQYSASGSAEERCWISSRPSRVARLRWRHVVERITGPVSSPSLAMKFG